LSIEDLEAVVYAIECQNLAPVNICRTTDIPGSKPFAFTLGNYMILQLDFDPILSDRTYL
jgi:hypothetical protein